MLRLSLMPRRVAWAGLVVGVGVIGGCRSVRPVQPAEYFEQNSPAVVWVTYADNSVVLVADPEIRRDTLRGMLQGARVKIPLSEIQSVRTSVLDRTKTAVLLTTLGVAAASSVYLMWISKSGPEGIILDCANDAVEEHPEEHPECLN
jgi:hypothetical protein